MSWYALVGLFFMGAFLTNSIPHFVSGLLGRAFPSPFAHPSGKGLSSPLVNVFWGLVNLFVGASLYFLIRPLLGFNLETFIVCIGVILMSYQLSSHFGSLKLDS